MEIPPPWIPPRPTPAPLPVAKEVEAEAPGESGWRGRWTDLRDRLARLFATESGAGPLDPFDIFRSAIFNLVLRVLRAFGFIAVGIAFGAWALAWDDVDWSDLDDWPMPWKFVRDVDTVEEVGIIPMLGGGLYALSFVGCVRVAWLIPVWLVGILIQIHWVLRCISEEDEEPWLLPVVVPLVAWQVFGGLVGWAEADSSAGWAIPDNAALPGALFLAAFTICWASVLSIWRWLAREGLTPWSAFEQRQYPFNPALFRWRRPRTQAAPLEPLADRDALADSQREPPPAAGSPPS